MPPAIPTTMKAAAIDHFGGPELLSIHDVPVPEVGPGEILIHVECAGVGSWDPDEREGALAQWMQGEPHFPYVLGSDGAGTVAALGEGADRVRVGDRVYAASFLSPKGGFYAEYAVAKADCVAPVPAGLPIEQAAAMPADGVTALTGLHHVLDVQPGEAVMVFGASGGVGHLAVQLAKRMGARVLAVASGADGVALAERLGADLAVDGKRDDALAAARRFAPGGLDAALVVAPGADPALDAVRDGGRVAYPNGVEPPPTARDGVRLRAFDGDMTRSVLDELNSMIEAGPFEVCVSQTFPLDHAADAHRAIRAHHVGKLALRVSP